MEIRPDASAFGDRASGETVGVNLRGNRRMVGIRQKSGKQCRNGQSTHLSPLLSRDKIPHAIAEIVDYRSS
jgi:hypothetical protein